MQAVTTTPRLRSAKRAAPQERALPPPVAEVWVGPSSIMVTIAVPELCEEDRQVLLTRHSIRIRNKRDPDGLHLVVPLPVAVEPERYVLRYAHGVFDFIIERASR